MAAMPRALTVRVRGVGPSHDGPFRLQFRPMTDAPERAASTLGPNQPAMEAIEAATDVDVFQINGNAGQVAWLELEAPVAFTEGLRVELLDGTTVLSSIQATTATTFFETATVPVTLPRTGTFNARVRRGNASTATTLGRYTLIARVQAPEPLPTAQFIHILDTRRDTLSRRDTVAVWAMTQGRDVALGAAVDIVSGAPGDSLTITVLRVGDRATISTSTAVVGGGQSVAVFPVGPTTGNVELYEVVVRARPMGADVVYRVRYGSRHRDTPETASATLASGDTLLGERFEDGYDYDTYLLDAAPNTKWIVMAAPTVNPSIPIQLVVLDARDSVVASFGTSDVTATLEYTATRLSLGTTGPFRLRVNANSFVRVNSATFLPLEYRLHVRQVDNANENGPATIAPNTTATGSIERSGDVDDIRFDAVAGREYYFHYRRLGPLDHAVGLFDGETSLQVIPLLDEVLPLDQQDVRRWIAPRTGSFALRATDGPAYGPPSLWPSPYEVTLYLVNTAPEAIAATGWALGDTVSGEILERRTDVDEYEFVVSAATTISLTLIAQRATVPDGIYLTLRGPNGNWVSGTSLGMGSGTDTVRVVPNVALTTPGTYRVRVESTGLQPIPYRFVLKP